MLVLAVLVGDDQAGRNMSDANGAVCGVYGLSAVAGATHNVDAKVIRIDLYLAILDLRHHGDGNCGGMYPALALRFWDALHAVGTAFKFQPRIRSRALYEQDRFFIAADAAFAGAYDLAFVAAKIGVAQIRAE